MYIPEHSSQGRIHMEMRGAVALPLSKIKPNLILEEI